MPNSTPELERELLDAVGVADVETLFSQIPAAHRMQGALELPPALVSEAALRRHLVDMLARNETCERNLSFLGGGIWQHHVPGDLRRGRAPQRVPDAGLGHAVLRPRPQPGLVRVREPARRADRDGLRRPARLQLGLRGRPRRAHGRPADRALARARARHDQPGAARGDPHLLRRCRAAGPDRDRARRPRRRDGRRRRADLERRLSARTAAVLFDNPSFLGGIEPRAAEIAALARSHGAETIVGVDPLSLGILAPPADYGADIVVGSTQPLGVHMSLRRRRRRLHRDARRSALRARVPDAAAQHLRDGRRRARLRRSPSSSRPRTAAARRATTGRATRSTSGPSRTPSTCR